MKPFDLIRDEPIFPMGTINDDPSMRMLRQVIQDAGDAMRRRADAKYSLTLAQEKYKDTCQSMGQYRDAIKNELTIGCAALSTDGRWVAVHRSNGHVEIFPLFDDGCVYD